MPQRFLKPGITNSERWNTVSWQAQSFFIRLLTLVDDYGRHDGRPSVLWAQCFAIWNEAHPDQTVDLQQVAQMLQQLAASHLITHYEADGKKVIQIEQWTERIRAGVKEKWPKRTENAKILESCSNLQQNSGELQPSSSPSSSSSSPTPTAATPPPKKAQPVQQSLDGWVDEFGNPIPEKLRTTEFMEALKLWHAYKREKRQTYKPIGAKCLLVNLEKLGDPSFVVVCIKHSIGQNWSGVFPPKVSTRPQAQPRQAEGNF